MTGLAEVVGIAAGALFFLSWVLQAWETRRAGTAVVTLRFFSLRLAASIGLLVEAVRVGSPGLVISMVGTAALILYNIAVIRRGPQVSGPSA